MSKILDYFWILLIVLLGSSHAFKGDSTFIFTLLPLSFLCYLKKGGPIYGKGLGLLVMLFVFFYIRGMHLGQNINGYALPVVTLLSYYFIAYCIKESFSELYVKVIVWLSAIGLVIWSGINLSDGIYNALCSFASSLPQYNNNDIVWEKDTNPVYSMYLFEIARDKVNIIRNTGAFYEPGRQAVVILIALAIEIFKRDAKLITKNTVILSLALLSTLSTMGYAGFLCILLGYAILSDLKKSKKVFLVLLLIPIIFYVYQLDFIGNKISEDYANEESYSRFTAMAYHWMYIMESPLWGNSFLELGSPNGITHIIAIYGIPFSIIYYCLLYKGASYMIHGENQSLAVKTCLFIVLLVNAFGQTITESPLYFTIAGFGVLTFMKKNNNIQ